MWKGDLQRRNINHKQQGGNGEALGGINRDWRENPWRTQKEETAGKVREKGLNSRNKVVGDPLGAESMTEDIYIQIVKSTFDTQEERGLAVGALRVADCVGQG